MLFGLQYMCMFFLFHRLSKPWSEGDEDLHSHTSMMSQSESCTTVWDWLCVLRLEHYSEAFQSAGLVMLRQCRSLTPDQLEQMGITLPGHQRRILASLNKTHGNSDTQPDTHSYLVQSERDQRLEETGHVKVLQRQRPVPIPVEEQPVFKEREKKDGETSKPTPREREKPVPRERQVSRMKEESGEGGEKMPIPGQRQMVPRGGKEEERDGGIDGEREKPVPKERTKFRSSAPVDCYPSSLVSPTSDTSLPPVPPRSTPNCPPQRFTSAQSPSPPPRAPASPKPDRHAVKAPPIQSRSVSQGSTPTITPTHTPTHAPHFPSAQTRPQTLAIQPHAQHLGNDGRRKTSPVSPIASPGDDRNAPPLPPKAGSGPKGPPPIPQRFPAQSPRTHR